MPPNLPFCVIKHRAPNGALRPLIQLSRLARLNVAVIKHRAPNGALRRVEGGEPWGDLREHVIKHRAPNGALRQLVRRNLTVGHGLGHKAPSAKRCIKTYLRDLEYTIG